MVRFERKRYLLFHVELDGEAKEGSIREAILNSYVRLFGLEGLGEAKLTWIGFDREKRLGILRCTHKDLPKVRAALALTSTINGSKARICTVRVSGTIKSIREFIGEKFKS